MGLLVVGIVTAVNIGATVYGAHKAGKTEKRARSNKNRLMGELEEMELERQDVINPYAGITDLGSMVTDLSSIASNPYANLSVSTAAAEMQIEEADIALANTLDTLRATGASAGGATALARMALESKKGVSASIEQQEAQNQKLRARGEERVQGIEMTEAKRVQNSNLSQAEKVQRAEVQGKVYEFETQESRDEQQLNRKQGQITNAEKGIQNANAAKAGAINAGISSIGNIAGSAFSG